MFSVGLATLLGLVALDWTAPAECPSRESVANAIDGVLGGEVPRDVVAKAAVEPIADGRWRLRLDPAIDGVEARREIEAPSCAELADATAILVGIEASRDPRSPGLPEPPLPSAELLPSPSPRSERVVEPRRAPLRKRLFAVGAAAGLGLGLIGSRATGGVATVAWFHGKNRLSIDASYFVASDVAGVALRSDLVSVGFTGCPLLLDGRLEMGPCVGIEGGRVVTYDVPDIFGGSFDDALAWAAVRAGGLVSYPIGPFALNADVGAVVPLIRHRRYVITAEAAEMNEAAPVAFRFLGGVELRFP